jgi:hypothetical protein
MPEAHDIGSLRDPVVAAGARPARFENKTLAATR